ncbi:MAG: pyridoxamine 5'-phosphate oxidase family protein [Planctomycetia bacterium]|jgi:putative heme iron utilization protein
MSDASTHVLHDLLTHRTVAALATLHDGRPFASMIAFAAHVAAGRLRLITHVSGLSAHTRDMLAAPEVCLLITAADAPDVMPQALPRVSIPAVAEFIPPEHPDHATLKAAYLGKFPQAADFFLLGDFSLVALEPTSARLIAGFARAQTLSAESLAAAIVK